MLGEIKSGIGGLSKIGAEAAVRLQNIPDFYPDVSLDEFIVMPNHVHALLTIDRHSGPHQANAFGKPVAESVSMHINHFKGAVKKWCNANGHSSFNWQSKFHDHVIRNEQEYRLIKNYTINNPQRWAHDQFYK